MVLHVPLSGGSGKGYWCTAARFFRPAKQGANHTHMGLSNNLAMDKAYYTLCAQHTSALPPSPVREMRESVSVRPQQPTGAVFTCPFTRGPEGPPSSLPTPPSSVYRRQGPQAWLRLSAVVLNLPLKAVLTFVSVVYWCLLLRVPFLAGRGVCGFLPF